MKSVGEAMAIGRTIHESLQKALASLETGLTGFDEIAIPGAPDHAAVIKALSPADARPPAPDRPGHAPRPDRRRDPGRHRLSTPGSSPASARSSRPRPRSRQDGLPLTAEGLRRLKMMGFTDARLAKLTGRDEAQVRRARHRLGVTAVFKRIDTCGAEFEAQTPYMYSTYEAPAMGDVECEARPSSAKKVVILGGGPNRIGQGIEFDYCCCHACYRADRGGL